MFYLLAQRLRAGLKKRRLCRTLYCILFTEGKKRFSCTRIIGRYISGMLIAVILWALTIMHFSLALQTELLLLAISVLFFGVGFVFSKSVQCITLLILAAFLGKSGRNYLRALSFAVLISGPIENLAVNGIEVVRAFTCSSVLAFNLTNTRFELMSRPLRNTMKYMQSDVLEVEQAFGEVRNVVQPLHDEVENENEKNSAIDPSAYQDRTTSSSMRRAIQYDPEKNIQDKYKAKFERRCKRQLNQGKLRCALAFDEAYNNCLERFPNPDDVCNPVDAIPNDFGKNYMALSKTEKELFGDNSELKADYVVHNNPLSSSKKHLNRTSVAVMKQFNSGRIVFNLTMFVAKRILSFLLIRIVFVSYIYHRKFKLHIDYDNLYISEYFETLDNRRKMDGKKHILPLDKCERKNLIVLSRNFNRTKKECEAEVIQLLQFSLEIITSCLFLLLDYLFVSLLNIVRQRSLISYSQEGEHTIIFKITGKGLLSRLLRSTLRNFNMHERLSTVLSNEKCLPISRMLPISFYVKLFGLYTIILIMIFKNTKFLRLRRLICGYFYPNREKKRIIFLYNSLLKKRQNDTK